MRLNSNSQSESMLTDATFEDMWEGEARLSVTGGGTSSVLRCSEV